MQDGADQSDADKCRAAILPLLVPFFLVSLMLLIGAGITETVKEPSLQAFCIYIGQPSEIRVLTFTRDLWDPLAAETPMQDAIWAARVSVTRHAHHHIRRNLRNVF